MPPFTPTRIFDVYMDGSIPVPDSPKSPVRKGPRGGTIRAPVWRTESALETEGRRAVVSKVRSLRWLEDLKESQRLTAREERRKEEILDVFRGIYDISVRNPKPPVFPPWRPFW